MPHPSLYRKNARSLGLRKTAADGPGQCFSIQPFPHPPQQSSDPNGWETTPPIPFFFSVPFSPLSQIISRSLDRQTGPSRKKKKGQLALDPEQPPPVRQLKSHGFDRLRSPAASNFPSVGLFLTAGLQKPPFRCGKEKPPHVHGFSAHLSFDRSSVFDPIPSHRSFTASFRKR